jgi:4-hydroxy-3-polyprenylbenzoate decarboxylase
MHYKSLNDFIARLEAEGELIRIKEFVSPDLEITEVYDRVIKSGGPALLFENNGTSFPLLVNAFGSYKRMCMALNVTDLDDIGIKLEEIFKEIVKPRKGFADKMKALPLLKKLSDWMPSTIKGKALCQEVVMQNPDITKLPVLKCWPYDGGNFITLPLVHTKDPETSVRNLGMYRMQVFGTQLTGMHWHLHKGSAKHFRKYTESGTRMPVSVVLGGDPVYTYVATAPLPENIDEYILAGFLRGKKVELVKCITNDIEVPADADFVIEGYVDPTEELHTEGPFGDHTGFYSLADNYPAFHVTCITHRSDAVYPATVVGIPPQEDCWMGKATERLFLTPIRLSMLPEVLDMSMPFEGVFHNIVIVKINKEFPGHSQRVMNSLWGAGQMMFNKIMIVADKDSDITDYHLLARLFSERVNIENDILLSKGPLDVLDHSANSFAFGGKVGFDLTQLSPDKPKKLLVPDIEKVKMSFPEVEDINVKLVNEGIAAVILSAEKTEKNKISSIALRMGQNEEFADIKFFIFTEPGLNVNNYSDVVWFVANNIDASRDVYKIEGLSTDSAKLVIDGTVKTLDGDGFQRDWPNVLAMTDDVIARIDALWPKLGLGAPVVSPSLRYKNLIKNSGAVRK